MFNLLRKFGMVSTVVAAAALIIVGAARYAKAQAKPGSSVIELCPPICAGANVTGVAPLPLGTQIQVRTRLVGVLRSFRPPVAELWTFTFSTVRTTGRPGAISLMCS